MKFGLFVKPHVSNIKFPLQFPADLVTFNEEILNGKLHFLCSGICMLLHIKKTLFLLVYKIVESFQLILNKIVYHR